MTKQSWILLVAAVALGAVYVLRFTDLGRPQQIQINVTSRPFAPNAAPDEVLPIIFALDKEWRLTALRITPLTEVSNAHPKCAWQLKAKQQASEPVRGFTYPDEIPGMQTAPGTRPQPLVAGIPYRVEVEAGRAHGQADFTPRAAVGAFAP